MNSSRLVLGLVTMITLMLAASTAVAQDKEGDSASKAPPVEREVTVSNLEVVTVTVKGGKGLKTRVDAQVCAKIKGAEWDSEKCACTYPTGMCQMKGKDGTPELFPAAYCETVRRNRSNKMLRHLRRQVRKNTKRIEALEKLTLLYEADHDEFRKKLTELEKRGTITALEVKGIWGILLGNAEDPDGVLKRLDITSSRVNEMVDHLADLDIRVTRLESSGYHLSMQALTMAKMNGAPMMAAYPDGHTEMLRGPFSLGAGVGMSSGYHYYDAQDDSSYELSISYRYFATSDGNEASTDWGAMHLITAEYLFGIGDSVLLGPSCGGFRAATGSTALEADSVEQGVTCGVVSKFNMANMGGNTSLNGLLAFHVLYGRATARASGVGQENDPAPSFMLTGGITFDVNSLFSRPKAEKKD